MNLQVLSKPWTLHYMALNGMLSVTGQEVEGLGVLKKWARPTPEAEPSGTLPFWFKVPL